MKRKAVSKKKENKKLKVPRRLNINFNFFDLPLELISIIFQYFSLADFTSLSIVQKQWIDIWRFIQNLVVFDDPKRYLNNIGKCSWLQSLKILSNKNYLVPEDDFTFLSKLVHLKHLGLDAADPNNFFRQIDRCTALHKLTNLYSLTLKNVSFKARNGLDFVTKFKQLHTLNLNDLSNESDGEILADTSKLSNLTSLRTISLIVLPIQDSDLAFLSKNQILESVTVADCSELNGSWGSYISSLRNVTQLITEYPLKNVSSLDSLIELQAPFFGPTDFDSLIRFSKLQTLYFSINDEKTRFEQCLPTLTNLSNLTLSYSQRLASIHLKPLSNLTYLEVGIPFSDAEWISRLSKLQVLRVKGRNVEPMLMYATCLHQLHTLQVRKDEITDFLKTLFPFIQPLRY